MDEGYIGYCKVFHYSNVIGQITSIQRNQANGYNRKEGKEGRGRQEREVNARLAKKRDGKAAI